MTGSDSFVGLNDTSLSNFSPFGAAFLSLSFSHKSKQSPFKLLSARETDELILFFKNVKKRIVTQIKKNLPL